MKDLRFILVDDNSQFREGLRFYLEKILKSQVIAEAQNGEDFLKLENNHTADIVLMDISMPTLNGIETTRKFLQYNCGKTVIALTSFEEKHYLRELIQVGFKGCILKKDIHNQILPAIKKVLNNDIYYPISFRILK